MPTQIQGLITPTYSPIVDVSANGEVLTEVQLTNTAVALGNRIEFVRQLSDQAASDPTLFTTFREDFHAMDQSIANPGTFIAPGPFHAENTWNVSTLTNYSVQPGIGTAKNPGVLFPLSVGSSNGECIIHLDAQMSFASFDYFCVVLNALATANANDNISFGLGQSVAAGFNPDVAGTDSLMCHYWRIPSTTNWQQNRTVGGSTFPQNILGPFTSLSYVKIEAVKQYPSGDIQFLYNGSLATTTSAAQMPGGNCRFLIKSKSVNTDASAFFANIDQVILRTKIVDRTGL